MALSRRDSRGVRTLTNDSQGEDVTYRDSRGVRTLTNDSQGEEYTGEWEIVTGANFLRKYQNTVIFIFASAQIIIDHANSKIQGFKISQFSFLRNQHGRE